MPEPMSLYRLALRPCLGPDSVAFYDKHYAEFSDEEREDLERLIALRMCVSFDEFRAVATAMEKNRTMKLLGFLFWVRASIEEHAVKPEHTTH